MIRYPRVIKPPIFGYFCVTIGDEKGRERRGGLDSYLALLSGGGGAKICHGPTTQAARKK